MRQDQRKSDVHDTYKAIVLFDVVGLEITVGKKSAVRRLAVKLMSLPHQPKVSGPESEGTCPPSELNVTFLRFPSCKCYQSDRMCIDDAQIKQRHQIAKLAGD